MFKIIEKYIAKKIKEAQNEALRKADEQINYWKKIQDNAHIARTINEKRILEQSLEKTEIPSNRVKRL